MAKVAIIPDTVKFAMIGRWTNGRPIVTVFHYHCRPEDLSGSRSDQVLAQANRIRDAWQDEMMDRISNNYTFEGVSFLDLDSETGVTGGVAPNGAKPLAGAGTLATQPPMVSVLVLKNITGVRGAKRGRMYLPVFDETEIDEDGRLTGAAVTATQIKCDAFFTAAQNIVAPPDGGWKMAVQDVPKPSLPPDVDELLLGHWHYVTGLAVQSLVASQRRRVRG